jgi:hypothetical protein
MARFRDTTPRVCRNICVLSGAEPLKRWMLRSWDLGVVRRGSGIGHHCADPHGLASSAPRRAPLTGGVPSPRRRTLNSAARPLHVRAPQLGRAPFARPRTGCSRCGDDVLVRGRRTGARTTNRTRMMNRSGDHEPVRRQRTGAAGHARRARSRPRPRHAAQMSDLLTPRREGSATRRADEGVSDPSAVRGGARRGRGSGRRRGRRPRRTDGSRRRR